MKPQRALGLIVATVLAACVAAWLTPPVSLNAVPLDGLPLVFTVR